MTKVSGNEYDFSYISPLKKIKGYTLITTGEEDSYETLFDWYDEQRFDFRYFKNPTIGAAHLAHLKSLRAGKKKIKVSWKKVKNAGEYQIAYKKHSAKKYKIKTVGPGNTSCILSKLSSKKYTVKVRTGKNKYEKSFYGKWSKTKTVKVK